MRYSLRKIVFFCIYRFNYRSQTVLYNVFVQKNIVLITFERFLLIIIYLTSHKPKLRTNPNSAQTQTSHKPKLRTNANFAQPQTLNKPKVRTKLNFEQTQTSNKSKFRTNQKVSGLRGTRIIRPWGDSEESGVRGTYNNPALGRLRIIQPPGPLPLPLPPLPPLLPLHPIDSWHGGGSGGGEIFL